MFGNDGRSDGSFGRVYRTIVENDSHPAINRPGVALGRGRVVLELKDENVALPGDSTLEKLPHNGART